MDIVGRLPQTNLQLLAQMRAMGYSVADMTAVARGYRLAMDLFSARFRACGKPFVCHLVGTAAVLVWLERPVAHVLCGLLHAAYAEGDFGSAPQGMTVRKRARLRAVIGEAAEALVADYTTSSRTAAALVARHAQFASLSVRERDVLVIQLANELDDFRDWAPHYAQNAEGRLQGIRVSARHQEEMARALGHPLFADALRDTYRAVLDAEIPAQLRSDQANGFTLVPASQRRRAPVLLRLFVGKVMRRLQRLRSPA